jgi:hypothetical protein
MLAAAIGDERQLVTSFRLSGGLAPIPALRPGGRSSQNQSIVQALVEGLMRVA